MAEKRLKLDTEQFSNILKSGHKEERSRHFPMSTMEKKRNNLQQEMFRLGIERKHSRRRSVKHGNKQFQKAEAAFSQKVLLNILDKGGSGIE